MLDHDFCTILEYRISTKLKEIDDEKVKGFWCDGVLLPNDEKHYSQKFVNDNRLIKMQVFVGKDRQSVYSLILKFGNTSLSRYARNVSIAECIPQTGSENWFKINIVTKEIELQLD